jgi:NAD(P)H-dependent FMN reductase
LAEWLVRAFTQGGAVPELIDAKIFDLPMLDRMYKEYPHGEVPRALEALAEKIRESRCVCVRDGRVRLGRSARAQKPDRPILEEWYWRPAAIVSYSAGRLAGKRAGLARHGILSEMGIVVVSSTIAVSGIGRAFDERSEPIGESGASLTRAFPRFADDRAWWSQAASAQRARVAPPY